MTDPLRPSSPPPRLGRILRSTPLRQALFLTAVFAAINMAALGASYAKMRGDRLQELKDQLARQASELEVSATPRAMSTIVSAKASAADPRETVIVFLARDGSQTGNARAVRLRDGLHLRPLGDIPLADAYIQELRQLDSGVVILASSLAPLVELRRTFGELLMLTLGPTVVLSLLVGTVLARRTASRVKSIEHMLAQLTDGDLSARLELQPPQNQAGDDLDRIGQRLNTMAARQQDTVEALRQVSSDIAHDLRTPLQRLSLHLEALEQALPGDSPALPHADALRAETERANAIFTGLLKIARIEGGTHPALTETVDLDALARRAMDLYQAVAEDNGQQLDYDPPKVACHHSGHPELLMQALVNLLENALRHAGPNAAIRIEVSPQSFAVIDSGPGIPQEARNKVTRRLFRLERSRSTSGNGLGLALVAAIARAHGAQLCLKEAQTGNRSDLAPGLRAEFRF